MDVVEATRGYERWLGRHLRLVASDLRLKHLQMRRAELPFLRATFYRWCQLWRDHARDERKRAPVLAVGDLHVENFGTWRDSDGRLIWGINDFDEAAVLPWSQDLVRLATSAHLAITNEHLSLRRREACDAIVEGYRAGLAGGGCAFVLEERHDWLRAIAMGSLRDPVAFWKKMDALPTARKLDPGAEAALRGALPGGQAVRLARRVAGLGSLGRPRFVALGDWSGGKVAREAKATAPSAWLWACGEADGPLRYGDIIAAAVRAPDPTVAVRDGWLLRRLAPHCSRVELADLPRERDEARLLFAMGFETANIHLGTRRAEARIRRELRARKSTWLHELTKTFGAALAADWKRWRSS